jgi:hypothetical protein
MIIGQKTPVPEILEKFFFYSPVIFMSAADSTVNIAGVPAKFEKCNHAACDIVFIVKKLNCRPDKGSI